MDLIIPTVAAVGGAIVTLTGAISSNYFATLRLQNETVWREKREAYRDIFDGLHDINAYSRERALIIARDPHNFGMEKDQELENQQTGAFRALARTTDKAALVISRKSIERLRTFGSSGGYGPMAWARARYEFEEHKESMSVQFWYVSNQQQAARDCLMDLREIARLDVRTSRIN